MKSLLLGTAALGVIALAAAPSPARADFITGSAWEVTNTQASDASLATVGTLGPADFTFTASGVAFSSYGNAGNTGNPDLDYTISSYLSSLGAGHNLVLTATGSGAGFTTNDSLAGASGTAGTLIELTGVAAFVHDETFTVAHDDGVELTVNGVDVLVDTGPTPPTTNTFTYTGATGNFAFNFAYGECCGPPAVFETTLVPATPVPEPGSLALLGAGLVGFGLIRRRRSS